MSLHCEFQRVFFTSIAQMLVARTAFLFCLHGLRRGGCEFQRDVLLPSSHMAHASRARYRNWLTEGGHVTKFCTRWCSARPSIVENEMSSQSTCKKGGILKSRIAVACSCGKRHDGCVLKCGSGMARVLCSLWVASENFQSVIACASL